MRRRVITSRIGVQLILIIAICFTISLFVSVIFANTLTARYIINTKNVSVAMYNIITLIIFIIGICTFIGVFLLLINKKIKYIRYASEKVKEIANGDLGAAIEIQGKNELAELCMSINAMSKELKSMFDNERKIESAKSELITSVSHDLRTPLTSIIGYVDLLRKKEYKDERQYDDYLETIYNKSQSLKKLIDELFEYTKLTSPDVKLNYNKIDINRLLEQLIGEYIPIFERENLRIRRDIPEENTIVNIDIEKMVRVFDNILINAKKYSDKPSEIDVRLSRNTENVLVSISNKVSNFTSMDLDMLFEKFYRVDKSRVEDGGTGLGLAIAKRITELHGGRIWAEYAGKIITFNVELPCKT